MAQLKSTNITGNLAATGSVLASQIIKLGGTSDQILMANGSVIDKSSIISHQPIKNLKTDNTTAQTTSANEAIAGSGTINLHKIAKTGTYSDLIDTPDLSGFATKTDLDKYLPKTTYEWNKEYAAGGNGAVSLGRYNLYDTQLTFDITTTTTITISGKLVIAAQNGQILKVTVYGDASNTLAGYLTIYQSAITGSRSWVEVFCNFPGWSKNKVHIYAVALNSATVTRQMESVTFTSGVPSGVTSGDTKWTGTIENDIILIKGPSSSTDNAIVRFDGTGGKTLQNSSVTIDDSGNVVPATTAASELGSSTKIWKRAYIHQLDLYREQGNSYGRISFYKPTMLTWFEYMSPNAVASPTGANTVQYGDVTSWARRSLIEPNTGYGWVWEAASNTANATVSGIMSLGSATGNLKVKGSVTANGFKHSDSTTGTNDYVLLAGGGTKPLSDFGSGSGNVSGSGLTADYIVLGNGSSSIKISSSKVSDLVALTGAQTITGNKTFTGNVITTNNNFEIKASSNTDDSWIKLTNATDTGYYAFGIRRPYDTYGLQLKIHPASGSDTYYDIWHEGNDGSGSGLDADKLDGQEGSYYLNYNNFTNKPTIPTVNNATLTMNTSGTGISGSQTFTANQSTTATFTVTLDSSAAGNRAANKVVLAAAAGRIDSEKFAITSGATVKATYQYNSTDDCVELVWA